MGRTKTKYRKDKNKNFHPFQKRKRDQQGRKQKRIARKGKKRKTTRKHWGKQRKNKGNIKTKIYAVSKAKTGPTRKKTKEKSKKRKKNKKQLENIGENKDKIQEG